jgi:mannosyltransferase OCH1-like enzyme
MKYLLILFTLIIIYSFLRLYNQINRNIVLEKLIIILIVIVCNFINITYGIISSIIGIFIYFIIDYEDTNYEYLDTIKTNKEGMSIDILYERDYDIEDMMRKAVIPFNIYQTWSTKNLPPYMQKCVNKIRRENPEFNYFLYDDNDCREFIKTNFDSDVLNAFDKLVPGAYKADLWRYCILYKTGGIYLDIKFQPELGFKLIELTDREYFVLERPYVSNIYLYDELKMVNNPNFYDLVYNKIDKNFWKNKEIGIYNAVMAVKPNNPVLLECIQEIVKNVNNNYYGYNDLYVTGPGLLASLYFKGDYSKIKDFELFNSLNGNYILNKKNKILSHYPEYRSEQKKFAKTDYYGKLWKQRKIYTTGYGWDIVNM